MMRSASAAPRRSPVNFLPIAALSIQSLPSGLTMTSVTLESARAAAMVGPKAVRSICRRRPWASSARGTQRESAMRLGLPWSGHLPVGSWMALPTGFCRKQVRLIDRNRLEHLSRETAILGDAATDLCDEHLVTLAADKAGGLLVAVRQGRRGGQEVAHEQRQGLGGHKLIAGQGCQRPVDLIEPARETLLYAGMLLRLEARSERLLDQRRLGAVTIPGHLVELARQRHRQIERVLLLGHLRASTPGTARPSPAPRRQARHAPRRRPSRHPTRTGGGRRLGAGRCAGCGAERFRGCAPGSRLGCPPAPPG